jgi:Type I restriction enzyme HindI endonuclease subunit-like, C-terminal
MFFVFHSGKAKTDDKRVTLIGPEHLAELVMDAGLVGWLIRKVSLEHLRAAVRAQLNDLVRVNRTRADFLTKFEELIESYNAGSRNIDDLFKDLLALGRALSAEQQWHVREQLTEPELTVFDLLTRPGPDLNAEERDEVKRVARHLLERVRVALVLDWRQRAQARAQVRIAIEDALDDGLPRPSLRWTILTTARDRSPSRSSRRGEIQRTIAAMRTPKRSSRFRLDWLASGAAPGPRTSGCRCFLQTRASRSLSHSDRSEPGSFDHNPDPKGPPTRDRLVYVRLGS